MAEIATAEMSSKDQVVIPEDIRRRLGLRRSSQLVVVGERDTVILKTLSLPTMGEFDMLIAQARRQDRRAGPKRLDVKVAVRNVRNQKWK